MFGGAAEEGPAEGVPRRVVAPKAGGALKAGTTGPPDEELGET